MMPYLIILLAFVADQLSKLWAADFLAEHGTTVVTPFLTLHEAYNRGIAFGWFQGIGVVVGWLTTAVIVGMVIYMHRLPENERLHKVGMAFMIGGGLGNLVDRIMVGKVLDFIVTPLRPGIFNVADVMIHVGLFLTLVAILWQIWQERQLLAEQSVSTG